MICRAILVSAVLGAAPVMAEDLIAAHGACAEAGRDSAACSEIITLHCLDTTWNLRTLTACRAGMARALETEAERLTEVLARQGERARAVEIARGADRVTEEACATLAGRMASPRSEDHDIRCALLRAHVTVYHLRRRLAEVAPKI
ncbi:MAG: hypothetical protein AAFV96_16875 [Pseudomonadota bacterium]